MDKLKDRFLGGTVRNAHGVYIDILPHNIDKLQEFPHLFEEEKKKSKPALKKKDAKSNKGTSKRANSNGDGANDSEQS